MLNGAEPLKLLGSGGIFFKSLSQGSGSSYLERVNRGFALTEHLPDLPRGQAENETQNDDVALF